METKLAQKILDLRSKNHTYQDIAKILNCSKGTVSYHCGLNQKSKTLKRNQTYRNNHIIHKKIHRFMSIKKSDSLKVSKLREKTLSKKIFIKIRKFSEYKPMFNAKDLLKKIGDNPICYLTGEPIDLNDSKSYHLDHIIPKSRGGDNSLSNCGLASKKANLSKTYMTYEEYVELCRKVVDYYDQTIARTGNAPVSSG